MNRTDVVLSEKEQEMVDKYNGELDVAEQKFNTMVEDFNNTKYELTNLPLSIVTKFIDILNKEIEWSFQEAVYLVSLIEELKTSVENKSEDGWVSLKVRELESIRLFLSKMKGNGVTKMNVKFDIFQFVKFMEILQESFNKVTENSNSIKEFQEKVKRIQFKLESWKMGIEPALEPDEIKEIELLKNSEEISE